MISLKTPFSLETIASLKLGDQVLLSGVVFTARDQALKKLQDEEMPELRNSVIYHCGPLVKREGSGWKIVSAGPTASSRMNELMVSFVQQYQPRAVIGKGGVGKEVVEAMKAADCVYLSFPGGCGALAAKHLAVESVKWLEELGMAEAVWQLRASSFGPLTVSIDARGNSLYGDLSKH